ncbi:anti-sigma factor [Salipiger sp. P9]|uniref:anti-sigma factor family protein n=1 Tax=Salipiger pentaromativorans TaxID=2943193 RepID=UPI00215817C8|nr:anti-sigma factor [Salipiger pentaromativorans]MCR8546758.1 anti-sigma factor [Salipiger pentaromativorans]
MMTNPPENVPTDVTVDELHAYADDQLPPERAAAVEAYLRDNPAAAARVADYQLINAALLSRSEDIDDEPIPQALLDTAGRPPRYPLMRIAAAVVWLAVGGALGWQAAGFAAGPGAAPGGFAERAALAYAVYAPETLHPVEVGAEESEHLTNWLSNRLRMSVSVPSLAEQGFRFLGGRLMMGETAPAALLMYESDSGRRLTLYISNEPSQGSGEAMDFWQDNRAGVVTWASSGAEFGLAGGFSQRELASFANVIRDRFDA